MTFEQFKRLVDEVKWFIPKIAIAGYGEPFIKPNLCKMLKYAADAGLFVHLHTNGNLSSSRIHVDELVVSGLRLLTISIDRATQETYEKYRVGG